MREHTSLKFALVVLVTELTFAFAVLYPLKKQDFFPFSRYSLFAQVPIVTTIPIVYIHQVDEKKYAPPVGMYQYFPLDLSDFLRGRDFLRLAEKQYYQTHSYEGESLLNAERVWFANNKYVKFEIRHSTIETVEFMKVGAIRSEVSIGVFEFHATQ